MEQLFVFSVERSLNVIVHFHLNFSFVKTHYVMSQLDTEHITADCFIIIIILCHPGTGYSFERGLTLIWD